jgi:hypothetical protein
MGITIGHSLEVFQDESEDQRKMDIGQGGYAGAFCQNPHQHTWDYFFRVLPLKSLFTGDRWGRTMGRN